MKVSGYLYRQALQRWHLIKDQAYAGWRGSLRAFPEEEEKATPAEVMDKIRKAELAIVSLETAQAIYNMKVVVDVGGTKRTLTEIIKLLGAYSRMEKLWRTATTPPEHYLYRDEVRDPNQVRATLKPDDAMKLALDSGKIIGHLKQAIAIANGTEIEENLDATLFE